MVLPDLGPAGRDVARASSPACSGAKKIASQPSAISPVSSRFFGPDRGQVDRDVLAHRVDGEPQRLARAVGQRQREVLALVARPSRGPAPCRTMSTYSRVRASGLSNRTPCQPSETCGPETPSPSRNRPPDSVSRVAAVIAVMAGVRAGIWKTAEPTSIALGLRGDPGEHGRGVGAVRLGGPDRPSSRAGRPPGRGRGCPRRCRRPSSRG